MFVKGSALRGMSGRNERVDQEEEENGVWGWNCFEDDGNFRKLSDECSGSWDDK